MMARIALGGFIHETNTFAPMPTTYEDFAKPSLGIPGVMTTEHLIKIKDRDGNQSLTGFSKKIESLGHEIFPIVFSAAGASGTVSDDAFDRITGIMIEGLKQYGPFDAVCLDLHGAMVTESIEDAESEFGRRVREVVGSEIPVVCTYDLHGNIPERAMSVFDAMVGYRTYPHIDMAETGERVAVLLDRLLSGKPVFGAHRAVPYLISPSTACTFTEPNLSIYKELAEIEALDDVLSITFMHGFLLSDIEHAGPSLFAYAVSQSAADASVDKMLEVLLKYESAFALNMLSPDEAVLTAMEKTKESPQPMIIADVQDNAGGGGTSDTVWLLDALVRNKAQNAALGMIFDADSADKIHAAGEGNTVELELGGKLMPGHTPYKGTFTVVKLHEGPFMLTGKQMGGVEEDLGKMAQIKIDDVRVVVSSGRTQNNDQEYFRVVGIEPAEMDILVVKSTNHYRADYTPIAQEILMAEAPGAHMENPTILNYRHLRDGVRLGGLGPEHKKK